MFHDIITILLHKDDPISRRGRRDEDDRDDRSFFVFHVEDMVECMRPAGFTRLSTLYDELEVAGISSYARGRRGILRYCQLTGPTNFF